MKIRAWASLGLAPWWGSWRPVGDRHRHERIVELHNDFVWRPATKLLLGAALPQKAKADALHIAVATVHGMDYLLTWNCAHIANAIMRPRIELICRTSGYEPPVICTPPELVEE